MVFDFKNISGGKIEELQQEFDKNTLNALINCTDDLIWSVDRRLNLITCNEPFKRALKSISGNDIETGDCTLPTGFEPEQVISYTKFYTRALSGESFKEIRNKNGCWAEVSFYPIRVGDEIIGAACNSHDITKIKQSEKNLIESEKQYRRIVETSQEGIWVLDADNKTTFVNKKMCDILEYTEEEMIGHTNFYFKDEKGQEIALNHIDRRRKGIGETTETKFVTKNGKHIWTQLSATPILDEDGCYIGALAMITDITERKIAEIERKKIVNDLMVRNTELEQFAYIVSHNLRAPVANIIGATNVLRDPDLSNEDKVTLNSGINDSVIKIDDVIKDLTLILQAKSKINATKEIVCFSELVEDIKSIIKGCIDSNDIEINYDFSEINELLTLKTHLYSVFYNLISNSVKYRKPNIKSVIEVKSRKINNKVELTFTDNGLGIDLQKNGQYVFGLYRRFHPHIEGKGMGLYMVKTQVETLGGEIFIYGMKDRGVKFYIAFSL